ncbi:hypothetical protein [Paenibacillus harenae]|uniref:hypothetical protein n=1 Tax=Paenibacillus harenae TaxID=306543 RepID=UPI0003FDC867|nr:hypothetical protein [Paenibacillus harenae]
MNIPIGMAAVYSRAKIVIVELDKCRDWQSFGYTDDGWHYFPFTRNGKEKAKSLGLYSKIYDS